jgi:hypothetical protein
MITFPEFMVFNFNYVSRTIRPYLGEDFSIPEILRKQSYHQIHYLHVSSKMYSRCQLFIMILIASILGEKFVKSSVRHFFGS